MPVSATQLEERTQDSSELLEGIMPSAITFAMMLRHKNMSAWLRAEFDGYENADAALPYRRGLPGHIVANSPPVWLDSSAGEPPANSRLWPA